MSETLTHGARRILVSKGPASHRCRALLPRLTDIVIVLLAGALLTACGSSAKGSAPTTRPATSSSTSATAPPSSTTSTSQPTGTRQVTYEPFSAQGAIAPTLRVTATVSGHCVAAGVAGNSSYRCFAGNGIYDPCFARVGATSGPLLCTSNPAGPQVVQFDVGILPGPLSGAPENRPWAMRISNGQICVLINAAWGELGPFQCQPAPPGPLADCHVPEQAVPWWTAACQDQTSDSSPFTTYEVDTAWL